jgi:hypothetical protein
LRRDDLVKALMSMVPLSVTQAERIAAIRGWAKLRAVSATAPEDWDLGRPAADRSGWRDEPPGSAGGSRVGL